MHAQNSVFNKIFDNFWHLLKIATKCHGVVIHGEYTYRKKVVFHFSALKTKAEMVSEASRGRDDFDKPENITDLCRQSNRTS